MVNLRPSFDQSDTKLKSITICWCSLKSTKLLPSSDLGKDSKERILVEPMTFTVTFTFLIKWIWINELTWKGTHRIWFTPFRRCAKKKKSNGQYQSSNSNRIITIITKVLFFSSYTQLLNTFQHSGRLLYPVPNNPWILWVSTDPLSWLIVGSFGHNCSILGRTFAIRCCQKRLIITNCNVRHTLANSCLVLWPGSKLLQ